MVKFFKIIEKIVYGIAALAIVAALAMMIIGAFVNLDKVEKELLSYMPYFYICATIVLLYKIVVLVFTSFYQIKIEKRKDYLDVILALQRAEEASTKQEDMLEQELTPFIENVKRLPEGNTDAVIREIQDRLPEVVQKLVDQRVAEIKQNIAKENEERIQEINVLSANVSDVLERREHLLNLEAEIKRCQEEEQKRRLAKTEEYTMLVFSLAGTSVENVEKVRCLDDPFHLLCYNIGKRGKDHGTERQSPVVIEQHAHISEKCHTCIKDLRGKLSHTFHAVIHVGDRLRDDISGALFFQLHTGFMYQCPVQDPLHPPVYIVGEPAHIEPLDISRQLHRSDHDHIGGRQPEHRRKTLRPCQDLHQAARHLSLKPWPRHEAQVIDQSRHCDQRQNLPFCPEIHHDLIWAKIFLFHFCSFLKSYKLF